MAFGEACWAAIEGSGGAGLRRQWRKMSDEGVNVDHALEQVTRQSTT